MLVGVPVRVTVHPRATSLSPTAWSPTECRIHDLLIRAGREDHRVIEQLCAPAVAGLWSPRALPLTGLVTDAQTAIERPRLRAVAESAGLPFLIDPVTTLLQDRQALDHAWAKLPFATADKITTDDLEIAGAQDRLIDETITFQREHGATILIPPYLYADRPDGQWFELTLQLLCRTAAYLRRENIDLPVAPVLAASLHEFGPKARWRAGIDRFLAVADTMNLRHINLSLSWSEPRKANYNALALLLTTARHVAHNRSAIAWRQGLYGAALTAAGMSGYETGAAQNEACHYPQYAANRRPQPPVGGDDQSTGGGGAFVYLAPFGRSVTRAAGQTLLNDPALRASLVCLAETCCPDGATSMVTSWREHAIRSRAREVQELAKMPSGAWRLNKIARDAERSAVTARLATDLLHRHAVRTTLPDQTFRALSRVAEELRRGPSAQVA